LDWPFSTPDAAIHAAFAEALQALPFRNEYSWVVAAQPGERRQFNGESWAHWFMKGTGNGCQKERVLDFI
jgi:hypothetical protein